MTEEGHTWGGPATDPRLGSAGGGAPSGTAPSGWYPDPWSIDHHRYWDGSAWTAGTFPNGPTSGPGAGTDAAEAASRSARVSAPPPLRTAPEPASLPPPAWTPPTAPLWTPTTAFPGAAPAPGVVELAATKRSRLPTGLGFVALVVAVMLVVGSLGALAGYVAFRHRSSTTSSASAPAPNASPSLLPPGPTTTVPADPSAWALSSLVIAQADVASTVLVQPDQDGAKLSVPTLDLCNGNFPSDGLRTARLQVSAYDGVSNRLLSTEAVLYRDGAATEQAFAELKSVAASCPSTPVVSPVGEGTATTRFNPPPDGGWAPTATVDRAAYDFVSTNEVGASSHNVAVYLRRGRVIMGLYFYQPDGPQAAVGGQTTIEAITGVFAGRMAQLPASIVNG